MTKEAMFVRNFKTPHDWPARPRPTTAIIREVDIKPGANIDIRFSRANHKITLADEAEWRALLKRIGAGNFNFPGSGDPKPKRPYTSPLSLNCHELSYVVYILTRKNWQFAREGGAPITISSDAPDNIYFESRRIDPSGGTNDGWSEKDNCIAAYMIVDGDTASHSGKGEYVNRINLHVDLESKGANNESLYMPIIIDPDIRHPGGSEP